ncbi:MAG: VWA domain-containing protein [Candidatus Abyssobacteria bacterium SURF_17]|uniref:VWA domain-containing protein n=1 Tax=Candidatus Abyssobacteria bacterium SURF_17 TaxID=2093361 RepID=A0A419EUQ6_9BACT|nr:MAG: VWA domain-containing protein [Candidatus Abyssubacteria bacterium SURF_17]
MEELHKTLSHIKESMDRYVIGHDDIKEAILLGLIGREHVYIEGPPGTAKTMLAEIAAKAANLEFFFYQLNRDTRLSELVGDYIIHRERDDKSELIRQEIVKGRILTADICVLDDISRAPGEALNVLLRVLNERKFGKERIPLLTTIATGNPARDDYYNEPLDLANLDRFTLQLRVVGLIQKNQWDMARQVIDFYATHDFDNTVIDPASSDSLKKDRDILLKVKLPERVKEMLLGFVSDLMTRFDLNDNNSLITDRTFLVKAVKMLKSKAVLEHRWVVEPQDLIILKYMTTFRVPPEVHEKVEDLIEEAQQKKNDDVNEEGQPDQAPENSERSEEGEESTETEVQPTDEQSDQVSPYRKEVHYDKIKMEGQRKDESSPLNKEKIDDLDVILKVIEGEVQRSIASKREAPGGVPKQYRSMRSLEDCFDSDPGETSVWVENAHPNTPRVFRRTRKERGGRVAVIRDISQSMTGKSSLWVSMVVIGLVEMARRSKMAVGYVEFNHQSYKYLDDGRFFTRNYEALMHKSMETQCSGFTDYQNALDDALKEFVLVRGGRQHVIFLTDGMPTSGDKEVKAELKLAKKTGVAIHSIFIGREQCPPILKKISKDTGGIHFQVMPNKEGMVKIFELLN